MLKSRSLATQFTLIFLLSLAILATAFYFILNRVYYSQLKSQAETVADNVDAFGAWVAQYGRVWVKDHDKSYLGHMGLYPKLIPASDGTMAQPDLPPVNFYSKNPALAQREFSEAVEKSPSNAKFRLTSHNYMNPVNKPDAFEARALERIRADSLKEYTEVMPGQFRYARTVYHKASCISCHGAAEKAPNDVKVRYGTDKGYDFKEGDQRARAHQAVLRGRAVGDRALADRPRGARLRRVVPFLPVLRGEADAGADCGDGQALGG
jgi:Protein of unknown function (DUF3365)